MTSVKSHRIARIFLALLLSVGVAAGAQAYSAGGFSDCEVSCGEPGNGCTLMAKGCTSCRTSSDPDSCEIEFEGCTGGTGCICSGSWTCDMYYYD